MKNLYLLIVLISVSAFAQTNRQTLENIIEAEKKSAAKVMNLAINPDTYNYDVTYAKLEFTVNPAVYGITGKVTTTYKALADMTTVIFDLAKITDTDDPNFDDQIEVTSVKQNNVNLSFTRNDEEIIITLPALQPTGASATVEISYNGSPAGSGFGSFIMDEHNGTPVMWTLSEPFGARDWWPCKQDLNDKIDDGIDVYITAPTQYTAVANGLQQSVTNNGNGTETTHFKHGYPIPAYLVAIAVTNYTIYTQQAGLGTPESPFFPIVNYSYPENATAIQNSVAVTPAIMNFYEEKFGPYPFRNEKYGHCQFAWGGGMEHTTVSFMTAGNNGYSRSLIAHELGHQWFGDKVTCGSWRDIWLNEGFATYLAAMVIEEFDGDEAFTDEKAEMIDYITSSPGGAVYLTVNEANDVNRIFSGRLTYNKGGMVLNMLRFKIGDTAFFQGLLNYLADPDHAYAYALTPDLEAHMEAASGMDLTEFFNDWVYKQGYPIYDIVAHNTTPGHATITIAQNQSHSSVPFFEMPVPIRLYGSGGQEHDIILQNTTDNQVFNIDVPFAITDVAFNVKNDIITRNSEAVLSTGSFDRMTAISLYPNPTASQLTLDLPAGVAVEKTTFYNTIGQKTKETTSETSWDVSGLASGVYFLNVETNAGSKQMKFVKK